MLNTGLAHDLDSVSYTHLDVYKRQVFNISKKNLSYIHYSGLYILVTPLIPRRSHARINIRVYFHEVFLRSMGNVFTPKVWDSRLKWTTHYNPSSVKRTLAWDRLSNYFSLGHFAAPSGLTSTLIYFIDVLSPPSSPEGCPQRNVPHDCTRFPLLTWLGRCYIRNQRLSSRGPPIIVAEGVLCIILYTRAEQAVCRQGFTHFMEAGSEYP